MHFEIMSNTGVQHLEKMIIQRENNLGYMVAYRVEWISIQSTCRENCVLEVEHSDVTRSVRIHAENFIVGRLKKGEIMNWYSFEWVVSHQSYNFLPEQ